MFKRHTATAMGVLMAVALGGFTVAKAQEDFEPVPPEDALDSLQDWVDSVDAWLHSISGELESHEGRIISLEQSDVQPPGPETVIWTAEDYNVNDQPTDAWGNPSSSINSWTIQEDSEGRKYLSIQADNLTHSYLTFTAPETQAADVEIWASMYANCVSSCNFYTIAGWHNPGSGINATAANYRPVGDHVRLAQWSDNSFSALASSPGHPPTQKIYQQRFRVNDGQVSARWWEHDGQNEPATWDLTATPTAIMDEGEIRVSNFQGTLRIYAFTAVVGGTGAPRVDVPLDDAPEPDPFTYAMPSLNSNGIYEFDGVNSGFIEVEDIGVLDLRPDYNWDRPFREWANPNFSGAGNVFPMRSRGEMTRPMARLLLTCETAEGCHEETADWIVASADAAHEIMENHWDNQLFWYYPNIAWEAYLLTGDDKHLDQMDAAFHQWREGFRGHTGMSALFDRTEQERVWSNLMRIASQLASVDYGTYQTDVVDATRDMILDRKTAGDAQNWGRNIWPGRHAHPHIAVNRARGSNADHDGAQSWVQAWVTNELARAHLLGHNGWDDVWDYNFTFWTNTMEIGPRKYYMSKWWLTLPMGEHDGLELHTFQDVVQFSEDASRQTTGGITPAWQAVDNDDISGHSSASFGHGDLKFSAMVWGSYVDQSRTCDHHDWLRPRVLDAYDKYNREPNQNNWFKVNCN